MNSDLHMTSEAMEHMKLLCTFVLLSIIIQYYASSVLRQEIGCKMNVSEVIYFMLCVE